MTDIILGSLLMLAAAYACALAWVGGRGRTVHGQWMATHKGGVNDPSRWASLPRPPPPMRGY